MSFSSKNPKKITSPSTPKIEEVKKGQINLDKVEIGIILNSIKDSNFKGIDVQPLFNLVVKLQNTYSKL